MFGQHPTFGRWVSSSFGTGFGTNTSTTGFGSSSFGRPAFGTPQTTASTTPFGSSAATGTTSLFGQTQPSTVYLGLNRDSWRGPCLNANQNQNRPFSFGTTTTSSGGTGANLFGTNNATSGTNLFSSGIGQTSGTVIKYNPVSGTDTMTRGGTTTNIQTKIEVITAMREFENRSLEELRVEDYLAGRKGPQQQQQQQQGFGFGQMGQQNKFGLNQPTTSSSWLSGSNTGGGGGLFGAKTQETKPLFGTNQTPVGFGTSTSGGGGGLFGSSIASPFGQSTTAPSTGVSFGQNNQNKGFSFGQTTSAATIFGQTNPVTQSGGSAFGSSAFNFENRLTYPRPTFSFDHFGNSAAIASPFGTTNTSTTGGFFGSANQNKTGFSLGTSNTGFVPEPASADQSTTASTVSVGTAVQVEELKLEEPNAAFATKPPASDLCDQIDGNKEGEIIEDKMGVKVKDKISTDLNSLTVEEKEQQVPSTKEQQTSSTKEQQTSSTKELLTSSPKELLTSSPKELLTSSTKEQQTSSTKEQQTSSPKELQTSSTKEQQTSSPKELQTSSPKELQTSSPKELQTSSTKTSSGNDEMTLNLSLMSRDLAQSLSLAMQMIVMNTEQGTTQTMGEILKYLKTIEEDIKTIKQDVKMIKEHIAAEDKLIYLANLKAEDNKNLKSDVF